MCTPTVLEWGVSDIRTVTKKVWLPHKDTLVIVTCTAKTKTDWWRIVEFEKFVPCQGCFKIYSKLLY